MTRTAINEYALAVQPRYRKAKRREKSLILDEFCRTTGYHRKSALRLLARCPASPRPRSGRPRRYGNQVALALKQVWEICNRPCSKRLAPFLGEMLSRLEEHGEIRLEPEVRDQFLQLSPASIDRLLKGNRPKNLRQPHTQSRAPSAIKAQVPVRTFGDWQAAPVGSLQSDLVAHCGETTEGFYLNTLMSVDVKTSWTVLEIIWGKGQERVGAGVHRCRQSLPFPVREFHTDNGGEFLNAVLFGYCQRQGIKFTRGRPYKKNDQAYAEQRNWQWVRAVVGYDRYSIRAAYSQMQKLYLLLGQYINVFQPVRKLVDKQRVGAKVKKSYDQAQTPYQRLLASGMLTEDQKAKLERAYLRLNPAKLKQQIDEALRDLWEMTDQGPVDRPAREDPPDEPALPQSETASQLSDQPVPAGPIGPAGTDLR